MNLFRSLALAFFMVAGGLLALSAAPSAMTPAVLVSQAVQEASAHGCSTPTAGTPYYSGSYVFAKASFYCGHGGGTGRAKACLYQGSTLLNCVEWYPLPAGNFSYTLSCTRNFAGPPYSAYFQLWTWVKDPHGVILQKWSSQAYLPRCI